MPQNHPFDKTTGYGKIAWIIIGLGALLRLLLYWANHPTNAYDDHLEPILLAIQGGTLPPLNACWECHQPPLFYAVSAVAGFVILTLGATMGTLIKLLQFLPLLYGLLTLPVIYLILKRLPISVFSGTVALALLSFFPRHIYMSAMHTNDTMGALFVSLAILVFLISLDEGFTTRKALLLGGYCGRGRTHKDNRANSDTNASVSPAHYSHNQRQGPLTPKTKVNLPAAGSLHTDSGRGGTLNNKPRQLWHPLSA